MAPTGSIYGETALLQQFADQLDPSAVEAAKAGAAEVQASARDCGDPLPGCQQLNAALTDAANRFTAFCTQVEQGIGAYAAIAQGSATDYLAADGTGRDAVQRALTAAPPAGQ
ncbi:hypothetical protein [Micromonospora musae]|uniref:hypothetical protein n=1 Tax=Micromonospora musae TaxID=1894970 RepID=UPI0033CAEDE5